MNRTTKTREARQKYVRDNVRELTARGMSTKAALETISKSIFISVRTATNDYYGS